MELMSLQLSVPGLTLYYSPVHAVDLSSYLEHVNSPTSRCLSLGAGLSKLPPTEQSPSSARYLELPDPPCSLSKRRIGVRRNGRLKIHRLSMASANSSSSTAPTTFHHFPLLPREFQIKIFEMHTSSQITHSICKTQGPHMSCNWSVENTPNSVLLEMLGSCAE